MKPHNHQSIFVAGYATSWPTTHRNDFVLQNTAVTLSLVEEGGLARHIVKMIDFGALICFNGSIDLLAAGKQYFRGWGEHVN